MRKKRAVKHRIAPDPKFNDVMVAKFMNCIMLDGAKNTARQIVYDAFDQIAEKTGQPAIDIFRKALQNAAPAIEVRARRVGGANYQVPTEVREERRTTLAIRWLRQYSKERREKTMAQRLANELIAAANGEGGAVKKREDVHRMAEANKAFAHYKW